MKIDLMSRIFLLSFFIIINTTQIDYAQTPAKENRVVVAAEKMNILYNDIENPINVAVSDYSCEQIFVTATNGKITGSNCSYSIIPETTGKCLIEIWTKKKGSIIKLGERDFRVNSIPLPDLYICTRRTKIEKEALLTCGGLNLFYPGFDYRPPFSIVHFDLYIEKKGYSAFDRNFTEEMKEAFKNVRQGDLLLIRDIKVHKNESPTTDIIQYEDLIITVE